MTGNKNVEGIFDSVMIDAHGGMVRRVFSQRMLTNILSAAVGIILAAWILATFILGGCASSSGRTVPTSPATTISVPEPTPGAQALFATGDEQLRLSPAIEGTAKYLVQDRDQPKVIYTASLDNPYGLKAGIRVGEYRHFVYAAGERTGGVALAAPLVDSYLAAALARLPTDQPKWRLTLPVDLTDCDPFARVQIARNAKPFADKPYFIQVSAPGLGLNVVNILGNEHPVVVDRFPVYNLYYIISQKSLEHMKIIQGEEMAFLVVMASFDEKPADPAAFARGDRIGSTSEPVLAGLSSVRGPLTEHTFDCILTIENCPVFLMANDKLVMPDEARSDSDE
jgi:hypothetical protein